MVTASASVFDQSAVTMQALIEEALEQEYANPLEGCSRTLCNAMGYAVLSKGKRIRPLLTLAVVEMLRGDKQKAIPAACAIELVHSASLIIDDMPCMDNADLRRFRKTHHRVFGEDLTILSALALLNSAYQLLNSYGMGDSPDPRLACDLIEGLSHAIGATGLIGGQVEDLHPEPMSPNIGALTTLYERKTVSLFTFAIEAGALIAGASEFEHQCLAAYAKNLGLAFQLYDDLIDATGDASVIGKNVVQDSGKDTFMRIATLEASAHTVKDLIDFAAKQVEPFGARGSLLRELPARLCVV